MTAGSAGRIFISYRRQETAWPARQLYDVLVSRFGAESVFKDVDDIDPGDDFVDRITEAVAACDVLLALIGPQWLTMTDATGVRRLDNPDDFVRLELKAALARGVRVVPILVDGARMPAAEQLPDDIAAVTRRQAVEINPVGFNTDRLLATLAAAFERTAPPPPLVEPDAAPRRVETRPAVVSTGSTSRGEASTGGGVVSTGGGVVSTGGGVVSGSTSGEKVSTGGGVVSTGGGVVSTGSTSRGEVSTGRGEVSIGSRPFILAGAAALVLALVIIVLVWRPWTGAQAAGPVPGSSPSAAAPVTSISPSASDTPEPADLPSPPIVAHRGGLEEHQFETQQAMEAAARAGFAVETDVRYTRDGVAVLVHDEQATKGLDCGGKDVRVSRTTWAELRETCRSKPTAKDPKKYAIPTLDATLEAIAAASPTAWVLLEVKTDQTASQRKAFLAAPAKYGLSERTVVTSFERSWLRAVRSADSSVRRMLFVSGNPVPASELKGDRLWGVAVEQEIATAEYVRQLQDIGAKVMVWVVNDARQWGAVAKLEPDLLMTAYPAKYQAWVTGR